MGQWGFLVFAISLLGIDIAWGSSGLRMSPQVDAARFQSQEPQIQTRIRLSDLIPPKESGPSEPRHVLRAQRNVLNADRMSYGFFGFAGSGIEDFVFRHADESSPLTVE